MSLQAFLTARPQQSDACRVIAADGLVYMFRAPRANDGSKERRPWEWIPRRCTGAASLMPRRVSLTHFITNTTTNTAAATIARAAAEALPAAFTIRAAAGCDYLWLRWPSSPS